MVINLSLKGNKKKNGRSGIKLAPNLFSPSQGIRKKKFWNGKV